MTLLYGGTFDPVHNGHLAAARHAGEILAAPVVFVPAGDPPHRAAPGAAARHRLAMLRLALAGQPGFRIDTCEMERPGRSYSVDTLAHWRGRIGQNAPLAWLVGADAFSGLHHWQRWEDLLALAHFVVAVRPGHPIEPLPEPLAAHCRDRWAGAPADLCGAPAGRLLRLDMPPHAGSASALRRRIAAGEPWEAQVPTPVAAYIRAHGLYRQA
ncbi:MAG TPA: nicotinate-nucleotide adenylyltransferase [Xanthomonadaceae bacterium]|nr:nicotinate-nucleotide adenylyltransferase [Xanthomonadaceae bacterium]